jgi:hypothetical protein
VGLVALFSSLVEIFGAGSRSPRRDGVLFRDRRAPLSEPLGWPPRIGGRYRPQRQRKITPSATDYVLGRADVSGVAQVTARCTGISRGAAGASDSRGIDSSPEHRRATTRTSSTSRACSRAARAEPVVAGRDRARCRGDSALLLGGGARSRQRERVRFPRWSGHTWTIRATGSTGSSCCLPRWDRLPGFVAGPPRSLRRAGGPPGPNRCTESWSSALNLIVSGGGQIAVGTTYFELESQH